MSDWVLTRRASILLQCCLVSLFQCWRLTSSAEAPVQRTGRFAQPSVSSILTRQGPQGGTTQHQLKHDKDHRIATLTWIMLGTGVRASQSVCPSEKTVTQLVFITLSG